MNWLSSAFTFATMAPAEMILARHAEILRADATLLALFGGAEQNSALIKICPFGKLLPLEGTPALFCGLPIVDRKPGPGANAEEVVIRDVVQFMSEEVTGEEDLWEPGLASLVSHIVGVVQKYQQLSFDTDTHGPALGIVQLASRVDLPAVNLEEVAEVAPGSWLLRLTIDFTYTVVVNAKTIPPRLWPLVTVGA